MGNKRERGVVGERDERGVTDCEGELEREERRERERE